MELQRRKVVINVTVLLLVIIVCVIEFIGGRIVKKATH